MQGDSEAPSGVTVTRGSDVANYPPRRSSVLTSESGELKFEEAEELKEGEVKEVIIYLPPSQDDFDSEVARSDKHSQYTPHGILDNSRPQCLLSREDRTLSDLDCSTYGTEATPIWMGHMSSVLPQETRSTYHTLGKCPSILPFGVMSKAPLVQGQAHCCNVSITVSSPSQVKIDSPVDLCRVSPNPEHPELSTFYQTNKMMSGLSSKPHFSEVTKPKTKTFVNSPLHSKDNKRCLQLNPFCGNVSNCKLNLVNVKSSKNSFTGKNLSSVNDFVEISLKDDTVSPTLLKSSLKEKHAFLTAIINKRKAFCFIVMLTVALLGYYNFVWIQ